MLATEIQGDKFILILKAFVLPLHEIFNIYLLHYAAQDVIIGFTL